MWILWSRWYSPIFEPYPSLCWWRTCVYDCLWLFMIVYDCLWLFMIVYDCLWLFMIVYDVYVILCLCLCLCFCLRWCSWWWSCCNGNGLCPGTHCWNPRLNDSRSSSPQYVQVIFHPFASQKKYIYILYTYINIYMFVRKEFKSHKANCNYQKKHDICVFLFSHEWLV